MLNMFSITEPYLHPSPVYWRKRSYSQGLEKETVSPETVTSHLYSTESKDPSVLLHPPEFLTSLTTPTDDTASSSCICKAIHLVSASDLDVQIQPPGFSHTWLQLFSSWLLPHLATALLLLVSLTPGYSSSCLAVTRQAQHLFPLHMSVTAS